MSPGLTVLEQDSEPGNRSSCPGWRTWMWVWPAHMFSKSELDYWWTFTIEGQHFSDIWHNFLRKQHAHTHTHAACLCNSSLQLGEHHVSCRIFHQSKNPWVKLAWHFLFCRRKKALNRASWCSPPNTSTNTCGWFFVQFRRVHRSHMQDQFIQFWDLNSDFLSHFRWK